MSDGRTISIPIELEISAKQYRAFLAQMENDFKKLKPGTSIADNISKSLKSARKMMDKLDFDMSFGITKQADISKLNNDFQSLFYNLDKLSDKFNKVQFNDLNIHQGTFGDLATDLAKAQKELDSFKQHAAKMKSASIGELFTQSKELQLFSKGELSKTGTSALRDISAEVEKITLEMNEASAAAANLDRQISRVQTKRAEKQTNKTAEAVLGITKDSDTSAATRKENLADYLKKEIFTAKGELRKSADPNQAKEILDIFFPNQDILAIEAKKRLKVIEEEIEKISQKDFGKIHSTYQKQGRESLKAAELDSQILDLQKERAAQQTKIDAANKKVTTIQTKANIVHKKLQSEGIIAAKGQGLPDLDRRLDSLEEIVENLKQKIMSRAFNNPSPSGDDGGGGLTPPPSSEGAQAALDAVQEGKNLKASLQQSINRWFGIQQVVTMVRDGIRQAAQDIKSLDAAMTNIAVVTDMSVSELWGKIDEYMSIAQQYGVTTQGVYEVSQLYYQQGLSTSEVMAATTETLKMARIAGMEYSEAADAMTVAIRAFKMEMSEAQHVTDVYSKVAAVTASDTEELAIAMSKTASSAESVGSSFENTTAMLAVMIETTRESAQNLGSALKSIISRYGEMKVGLTVDSEGEEIDYNKTDTALKSIGISIKDAQGQFRDFDDVIFELSEKWDSLDKNTQRYIATIMAGNRQQSRFIALVDNWERLDEVATAAQDSEDAGLLQYAKTLDSLETKINNIKTSFQEFYMEIFNGPVLGKGLEFINKIIQGFTKLSKISSIINIASLFNGLKFVGNIFINTFSQSFGTISSNFKKMLEEISLSARSAGRQSGQQYAQGVEESTIEGPNGKVRKLSKGRVIGYTAASLAGMGLTMAGSAMAEKDQAAGALMTGLGSGLSVFSMLAGLNPILAAVAGGLTAIISVISSMPSELEKAQQELQQAEKDLQEKNIKRAEAKEEENNLKTSIENLKKLERARYSSTEAEKEYQDALTTFGESYPTLVKSILEGSSVVASLGEAEAQLAIIRQKTLQTTIDTAIQEGNVARAQQKVLQAKKSEWTTEAYKYLFGNIHLDNKQMGKALLDIMYGKEVNALDQSSMPYSTNSDWYEELNAGLLNIITKNEELQGLFAPILGGNSQSGFSFVKPKNVSSDQMLGLLQGLDLLSKKLEQEVINDYQGGRFSNDDQTKREEKQDRINELRKKEADSNKYQNPIIAAGSVADQFLKVGAEGDILTTLKNYYSQIKAMNQGISGAGIDTNIDSIEAYFTWLDNFKKAADEAGKQIQFSGSWHDGSAKVEIPEVFQQREEFYKSFTGLDYLQALGIDYWQLLEDNAYIGPKAPGIVSDGEARRFNYDEFFTWVMALSKQEKQTHAGLTEAESEELKRLEAEVAEDKKKYSAPEEDALTSVAKGITLEDGTTFASMSEFIDYVNAISLEQAANQKKIDASSRVAVSSLLDAFYNDDKTLGKGLYDQEWIKELATSSLLQQENNYKQLFDDNGALKAEFIDANGKIKEDTLQRVVQQIYEENQAEIAKDLTEAFKSDSDRMEAFKQLTDDLAKGIYTNDEAIAQFSAFSKYTPTKGFDNDIIQQAYSKFAEAQQTAKDNLLSWMSFDDFKDWDIITTTELKDGTIQKEFNDTWQGYLDKIPFYYYSAVGNVIEQINKQIEDEKIDPTAGEDAGNKIVSLYANLPEKYRSLLAQADLSSQMGQLVFAKELRKAGATNPELEKWLGAQFDENGLIVGFEGDNSIPTYANNLVASYQTVMDQVSSGLEGMRSTLDKASQAMNVEDALDLAKKFDIEFSEENFGFDKDTGKVYLKNREAIGKYLDSQFQEELNLLDKQQKTFDQATTVSGLSEFQQSFDEWRKTTTEYAADDYNFEAAKLAYIADLIKQKEYLQQGVDWLETYYEEQSELLNLIEEYQAMPYAASSKISSDDAKIYQLMKDKGRTGYSEQEIGELDQLLEGINLKEYAIKQIDGTYDIDTDGLNEILDAVPPAIGNLIKYIINDVLDSSLKSIYSFGEAFAKGEDVDLTEYFGAAVARYGDAAEEMLKRSILMSLDSSDMTEQGQKNQSSAKQQLKYWIASTHGLDADSQEVEDLLNEFYSGWTKGIKDTNDSFRNLQKKIIEQNGVFTADDDETLKELDKTQDDVLNSIGGSISERIKRYGEILKEEAAKGEIELGDIPKQMTSLIEGFINNTVEAQNASLQSIKKDAMEALAATGGKGLTQAQLAQIQYISGLQGDIYSSDGKGGYDIDDGALKLLNLMYADSFAQYEETTIRNRIKATEDFLQTALSDTSKVETSQVQELYKSLGKDITWQEAQSIAETIVKGGAKAALEQTQKAVSEAGIKGDVGEYINSSLQRIFDLLFDSINEAINSAFDNVGAGISGTLKAADYAALLDKYNGKEGYIFLSGQALKTSEGLKLNRKDTLALLQNIRTDMEKNGTSADFAAKALEVMKDGGIEYKDIQEEILALTKQHATAEGEVKGELEGQLSVLKEIQKAMKLDPEGALLDFMNQDPFQGMTEGFDNFVGSIEQVQEIVKTFTSGESIGYKDFYNMMDFLNNSGQWNNFAENIVSSTGKAAIGYEEFVNSVMRNTNELGKINIKGVAAEMGISVEAAMGAMKDSMSEGLQQVAKDQIKYLTGIEQMLEAMLLLEGIGDINLDMSFQFRGKERFLSDVYDIWSNLDLEGKKELELILKTELEKQGSGGQAIVEAIWGDGDGMDFLEAGLLDYFATNYEDFDDPEFMEALGGLTEGLALDMATILADKDYSEYFDFDKDGNATGFKQGMMQSFFEAYFTDLTGIDFTQLKENASAELSELIAREGGLEVDLGGNQAITITGIGKDDALIIAGDVSEDALPAIQAKLEKEMGRTGIELSLEGQQVTVKKWGSAVEVEDEEIESIETKFQTTAEAAKAVNDAITGINSALTSFSNTDVFKSMVEGLTNAKTVAQELLAVLEAMAGIKTVTYIEDNLRNEDRPIVTQQKVQGDPMPLDIDNKPALDAISEVDEALKALDTNLELTATDETGEGIASAASAIGNIDTNLEITATDSGVTSAVNSIIAAHSGRHITLGVTAVAMEWTGTMNNISGSAFADGSIGRLHSGAQLANKVLVGELGPELAVYDGQYHMLGANGAEFVNLPKDAIIFNHIQTAGILDGQFNIRGTAMAEGNVSGPAFAGGGGIAAALAAVRRAKAVWQGLLDNLTAADLFGGGGGGGGGGGDNSIKAVTQELQEWYNLSRQIANIEQEINNLMAERANIQKKNGAEYLRNLREQEKLLYDQITTQETLLQYQELQLQRQADHINQNQFWSKFLTVGEDGLLQYIVGNEADGGKGELTVLQQMNEMSGAQQLAYLQNIGYTYTDQDGKQLEGADLIAKFFEELQQQIDEYDALYDTVHETLGTLEELETQINEINEEVKQNQLDLEQNIYDIIVSAWEKEIEEMQKQTELIKEANDEYINGLNKAIEEERKLYDEQQSTSDREALQRQLSLLRRSGGSAQEIYDLEQQLNDMLKDEYFNKQEKMIENIQDASEEQVRKLEEQIKLQEDALEYQKENGVIWTKVYEVLSGSEETITAFMQGNSPEFFEQSNLQQEEMLTDWAHKIGIYTKDRQRENHEADAAKMWSDGSVWKNSDLAAYQDVFNAQSAEAQGNLQTLFNKTYANALLDGKTHEEAIQMANAELLSKLKALKDAANAQQNTPNTGNQNQNQTTGTQGTQQQNKEVWTFTFDKQTFEYYSKDAAISARQRKINSYVDAYVQRGQAAGVPDERLKKDGLALAQQLAGQVRKKYSTGGLVDYTGLAMVHGSSSKPEAFLNAEQTAQIREALAASSKGGVLSSILNTLQNLQHSISSITHFVTDSSKTITISPNAINISVGQLANSYDVDDLSNDIMNRIASIAAKASGRGVNRR